MFDTTVFATMPITMLIIVLTSITSIMAFSNERIKSQLIFSPYYIKRRKDWFRFLSSGFLHADFFHLFLNMYVLFIFGDITEQYFMMVFGRGGATLYILLYVIAIILSEVYSYYRHQDNPNYASLGASGAVSAIIFASILFQPLSKIGLLFLPGGIPGFLFGILYLLYSMYMARNATDNIGHNAHFYGAVFGFIFPIVLKPELFVHFMQQIA